MLGPQAETVLKKWNYPFETLPRWGSIDPWCTDVAVEIPEADVLFLIYSIGEWGMCKYCGRVVVFSGHENAKLLFLINKPLGITSNIQPFITSDRRYIIISSNEGVLFFDIILNRVAGIKLVDRLMAGDCTVEETDSHTLRLINKYEKINGSILDITIDPKHLPWRSANGEQFEPENLFQYYEG